MKKLLFTAICVMAFSNGFASNDVKEVIEEQVAFFGDPDECAELIFTHGNFDLSIKKDFLDAMKAYGECLNSTILDEVVIEVEGPKKNVISK